MRTGGLLSRCLDKAVMLEGKVIIYISNIVEITRRKELGDRY